MLLYDSKFKKFLGKFRMHWLGPYVVKEVIDGGVVQLVKLNEEPFPGRVNGSHVKPYMGGPTIWLTDQSIVFATQQAGQRCETINIGTKSQHRTRESSQMQRSWKQKGSKCRQQQHGSWGTSQHTGTVGWTSRKDHHTSQMTRDESHWLCWGPVGQRIPP